MAAPPPANSPLHTRTDFPSSMTFILHTADLVRPQFQHFEIGAETSSSFFTSTSPGPLEPARARFTDAGVAVASSSFRARFLPLLLSSLSEPVGLTLIGWPVSLANRLRKAGEAIKRSA